MDSCDTVTLKRRGAKGDALGEKRGFDVFVIIVNTCGIIRYISTSVIEYLEYSYSEMVGKSIFHFLAEDDASSIQTALLCLSSDLPIVFPRIFECWMRCKNNHYYRRIIMHVAPLKQKENSASQQNDASGQLNKFTDERSNNGSTCGPGLACLARVSKLSLSAYPRSSFGLGKFTTILSIPSTTIQHINAIDGLLKIRIEKGRRYLDYVHEMDRKELLYYFELISSTRDDNVKEDCGAIVYGNANLRNREPVLLLGLNADDADNSAPAVSSTASGGTRKSFSRASARTQSIISSYYRVQISNHPQTNALSKPNKEAPEFALHSFNGTEQVGNNISNDTAYSSGQSNSPRETGADHKAQLISRISGDKLAVDSREGEGDFRLAIVQSNSSLMSPSTTAQFNIQSNESKLILATHTVIRLVDDDQSPPTNMFQNELRQVMSDTAQALLVNSGANMPSSPSVNDPCRENGEGTDCVDNQKSMENPFTTRGKVDYSESEHLLRDTAPSARVNRSQRLLQLLTCDQPACLEEVQGDQFRNPTHNPHSIDAIPCSYVYPPLDESVCGTFPPACANLPCPTQPPLTAPKPQRKRNRRTKSETGGNKPIANAARTGTNNSVKGKSKKDKKAQNSSELAAKTDLPSTYWDSPTILPFVGPASLELTGCVRDSFMGVEESSQTLSRTIFDRDDYSALNGNLNDDDFKFIREDPGEREQIIQFVVDSWTGNCFEPIDDSFLEALKSELISLFQEVTLSQSWHRRESDWMNHALQLAKLNFDRSSEECQRMQSQQVVLRPDCFKRQVDDRLAGPQNDVNQSPQFVGQDETDSLLLMKRQHQQMYQRRSSDYMLSGTQQHSPSPNQQQNDCRTQSEMLYYPQLPDTFTGMSPTLQLQNGAVRATPNGELFYCRPRQIFVPNDNMIYHRQPILLDRRRVVYDVNGNAMIVYPNAVYPIRSKDVLMDRLVSNHQSEMAGICRIPAGMQISRCRPMFAHGSSDEMIHPSGQSTRLVRPLGLFMDGGASQLSPAALTRPRMRFVDSADVVDPPGYSAQDIAYLTGNSVQQQLLTENDILRLRGGGGGSSGIAPGDPLLHGGLGMQHLPSSSLMPASSKHAILEQ